MRAAQLVRFTRLNFGWFQSTGESHSFKDYGKKKFLSVDQISRLKN